MSTLAMNPIEAQAITAHLLAALTSHMEHMAWHRANVAQHATPELEF